ncbi:3-hydroxyacyl-ACP dehydratase FabZ family protein [Paenibacillus lutrae]|uniref:FabA-like domain protein n=1 Tax=Paenibacillus lutrae TaxID=2078573 RepID=A0A7X3JYE5_9BACL|nr:FabA-like domain protein [Paenibacillus lutrae]MVO98869.1 FabA-like domain protein [Paenibacillus lutrae]
MSADVYSLYPKPWIMVDRIIDRSAARITTVKLISASDFYLQGHFPSYSVYPGMLMVECILQSAELLLGQRQGVGSVGPSYIVSEIASRFLSPVTPGDTVVFETGLSVSGLEVTAVGRAGSRTVIHARMKLAKGEEYA